MLHFRATVPRATRKTPSTATALLHVDIYLISSVWRDLDWFALSEPAFQHRGIAPLLVPGILNGYHRAVARGHPSESERSIAIALIALNCRWPPW
jgi:hypothetical protein